MHLLSSQHCEYKALPSRKKNNVDHEGDSKGSKAASKFLSSRQNSHNRAEVAADSKSPPKQDLPTALTNSDHGSEAGGTGSKSPSKKGSHIRTRSNDWFETESKVASKAAHVRTRSHDMSEETVSKAVSKFLSGRSISNDEGWVGSKAASKGFHRRTRSHDGSEAGKFSKAASKFLHSRASSNSLNSNDGAEMTLASPSKVRSSEALGLFE